MHLPQSLSVKLTAGLLAAAAMISPAFAVSGTVNADGGLRLRNGVGSGAAILTTLPNGVRVDVSGVTEEGWFQVAYNGVEGFVSGAYLELDEEEAGEALDVVEEPVYGKVTQGPLNVRNQPSTDASRVRQLSVGAVVKITETLDGWYAIDGGYVSADYIKIVDAAEAAAPVSENGASVVEFAKQYLGRPYVYGGASPRGFDCSGFTMYVYSQFGVRIAHGASSQMNYGASVSRGELQPGDLVFFKKSGSGSSRASHVGIYVGGNQFIHASTYNVGVIISDLNSSYYAAGFVGARRLV